MHQAFCNFIFGRVFYFIFFYRYVYSLVALFLCLLFESRQNKWTIRKDKKGQQKKREGNKKMNKTHDNEKVTLYEKK